MTQPTPAPAPSLFRSFWLGGFEGAYQKLCHDVRVDMTATTQHDTCAEQDYARLPGVGIRSARESLRWYLIDRGDHYDFSSLLQMTRAAQAAGVQQILSLCHYGWPEDVDLFSPSFPERFARYCKAVAKCISEQSDEVPFYSPVNEISFFAWAVAEAGFMHPCAHGRAGEAKDQLTRAAIAGIEAIWEVDRRARIVHVDPMIQVIAPPGRPDLARHAATHHFSQYQAYDFLGGWERPELGGDTKYLDIIGVNFYHDNQWELERPRPSWEERIASGDPRWATLQAQLEYMYYRYQRPLLIGETSHFGIGRGTWIQMVANEVYKARQNGVPVEGICIYPILDRPDWHDPSNWHNSGLWDLVPDEQGNLERVIHAPYLEGLRLAQKQLA